MRRIALMFFIVAITLLLLTAVVYANITAPPNGNHDVRSQHCSGSGSTVTIIEPTTGAPVYVSQGASFTVEFNATVTGPYTITVNTTNVGSGSAVAGTNSKTATLPSPFAEGTYDLKVTVGGESDTEVNAVVLDNTPPVVTLTSPNGGERWHCGSKHDITWIPATDANLVANPISLYSSSDNGSNWRWITASEANNGSYSWTLPCVDSQQCLVRVDAVDKAGNVGFDTSDDVFTILCAEEVVFQSDRASDWEVYKMTADGHHQENLTDNEADDTSPAWSPDGEWIAFASNRDGNWEVYKMTADGHHQQNLTDNEADDTSPAWSPDGEEIVFASDRDGNWEVYKMRASGLYQENLTDNEADDASPTWSPDGEWIVFQSNRDGDWEVYKMKADGYHQQNLTENPAADTSPVWWPYCDRIFFQSNRDGDWEVYKMHDRGYHQENLTDNPAADMIDSWAAPPLTPTPTPTSTATPTATPTSTPTATPTGTVTPIHLIYLPIILKDYP